LILRGFSRRRQITESEISVESLKINKTVRKEEIKQ
jgi:hypothetical protein